MIENKKIDWLDWFGQAFSFEKLFENDPFLVYYLLVTFGEGGPLKMGAQKKEPICIFKDQAELDACLKWWKKRLFLNDWIISAHVIPMSEFNMEDAVGENLYQSGSKCAVIHICTEESYPSDAMLKQCQEKTLVHELLHCNYCCLNFPDSYEGKITEIFEHQRLEELARSLIMIKYGVDADWFENK